MHQVSRYRNGINSDSAVAHMMQEVVSLPLCNPSPPLLSYQGPATSKSDGQICRAKRAPASWGPGRSTSHKELIGCLAPLGQGWCEVAINVLHTRSSSQEHRHLESFSIYSSFSSETLHANVVFFKQDRCIICIFAIFFVRLLCHMYKVWSFKVGTKKCTMYSYSVWLQFLVQSSAMTP